MVLPSAAEPESALYAAIDLGSNSFHLIVARMQHGQLERIDKLKETVRLAEGLKKGSLSPAVAERALLSLAQMGERIHDIPAENVRAVGTNTLRQIRDASFLRAAEEALGHPIDIISGQEEARLVYLGVAHDTPIPQRRLVIDVGGGSTELIVGEGFSPLVLESIYLGCVTLTERHFGNGKLGKRKLSETRTAASLELSRVSGRLLDEGFQVTTGSSGTMKAIARTLHAMGMSDGEIERDGVEWLWERLHNWKRISQIDWPELSVRRRDVIVGGLAIVAATMETLEIDRIGVSEYALREGTLHDLLGRRERDVRETTVAALIGKYDIDRGQAERVERTAERLIAQIQDTTGLEASAKNRLRWAAQLHEIGLTVSHHGYHRPGAYLLEHSDLPGFARADQQAIAQLVCVHRRSIEDAEAQELLERKLQLLAALLRVSVILNRTRSDNDQPDIRCSVKKDRLSLRFPEGFLREHPMTRAGLQQEARVLEKLGLDLQVR